MAGFWMLPLIGLLLIAMGIWQCSASLDILWQRQERYLLARGLSPQRNDIWERNTRRSGAALIVIGLIVLIVGFMLASSIPQKMSGVSIDGHELTQDEWDGCHHDMPTCLSAYMNQHPK